MPSPLDDLREELRSKRRLQLRVKALPKSSSDEICDILPDGTLKVKVRAVPERGKANEAICDVLARAFGVSRRNVVVLRGATAVLKQVEITVGRHS